MGSSSMTGLTMGGAVLILVGMLGLAIPYFTTQQTTDVAKIGDLKLQATENKTYAIPPMVAGGALGLGVILLGAGLMKRS